MKIALVGPGIMPIPPPGHGAVEILIWDYYMELCEQGHEVDIINQIRITSQDQSSHTTPYSQRLIQTINQEKYDFVHIHYDCLYHIMPYLTCKTIGITSHYPYIDQPEKHRQDGYHIPFQAISANNRHHIFALSEKDYNMFSKTCSDPTKIHMMLNGSNHNEIVPKSLDSKTQKERSIYIGKIEARKQQHKYKTIPNLDFYGRCDDQQFKTLPCYKGEPSREFLMSELANYGNMVLLSTGENGTPLVIKEALMAGLPIVTNKYSANDLDLSLPFIDIIPDEKADDLVYIQKVIEKNRLKQVFQKEIRDYAIANFSWEKLVNEYANVVSNLL